MTHTCNPQPIESINQPVCQSAGLKNPLFETAQPSGFLLGFEFLQFRKKAQLDEFRDFYGFSALRMSTAR